MALTDAASLNRLHQLCVRLAQKKGRTVLEVTQAVLSTKTLERMGYAGNGHVDEQAQCDAAIAIVERWLSQ